MVLSSVAVHLLVSADRAVKGELEEFGKLCYACCYDGRGTHYTFFSVSNSNLLEKASP